MPQVAEKPNKNAQSGDIKPDNIRIINRRVQVTARWLMSRFKIPAQQFFAALAEIEQESNIVAFRDGQHTWVCKDLFYDLSIHPLTKDFINESVQQAVLQLLGAFERKAA